MICMINLILFRGITIETSDRRPENIIGHAMFYLAVERQRGDLMPNGTFSQQQREIVRLTNRSDISRASNAQTYLGKNTTIPFR